MNLVWRWVGGKNGTKEWLKVVDGGGWMTERERRGMCRRSGVPEQELVEGGVGVWMEAW
jgi:hypothetical protein